ncbi:MAG TPA: hypothetical protein VGN12_20980 [Pirellulales bacterium]|jgi:hypothetical protein
MHRVLLPSVASLVLLANLSSADTVTLTFSGRIDGSDTIDVTPTQATWDHTYFGFPTGVDFDGQSWDPQTNTTLSDAGSPFIPSDLSDYRANVVQTAGRDQVAAEIDGNDLQIHLADTPNGDDLYTFQVVLTKEPPRVPTTQTLLHVQGTIDGSDRVVITNTGATLDHYFWGTPTSMSLNGVAWDPSVQPTLSNSGATTFLPNTVDLSSATFVKNEGRDLASFEVFNDHVDLIFADNPLGSSNYDVTLSFSSPVPEPGTAALAVSAILTTAWGLLGRRPAD